MHLRNDDVRSDNLQDERGLLQKGITCEDLSSIGVPGDQGGSQGGRGTRAG